MPLPLEGGALDVHAEGRLHLEHRAALRAAHQVSRAHRSRAQRVLQDARHLEHASVARVAQPHAQVLLRDENAAPELAKLAMVVVGEQTVANAARRRPEHANAVHHQLLHQLPLERIQGFEHGGRAVAEEDAGDAELIFSGRELAHLHDHLGEELRREECRARDVDEPRQEAAAHVLVLESDGEAKAHQLDGLERAERGQLLGDHLVREQLGLLHPIRLDAVHKVRLRRLQLRHQPRHVAQETPPSRRGQLSRAAAALAKALPRRRRPRRRRRRRRREPPVAAAGGGGPVARTNAARQLGQRRGRRLRRGCAGDRGDDSLVFEIRSQKVEPTSSSISCRVCASSVSVFLAMNSSTR